MDKKTTYLKYIVYAATGLILVALVLSWKGLFDVESTAERIKILSDGFTLPGILFTGLAGLGWVSSKGGYDLFGYAWSSFTNFFVRDAYFKKQETYFDYVQRRNASRKPFNKVMLVVGLALLFVGIVITIIYLAMK